MVPNTLLRPLARLRRRERLLAFVWGVARWLAVVAGFLAAACLVDWLCDRWDDTPWAVRIGLFAGQVAIAVVAAGWFIVRPLMCRLGYERLALWVEDRTPELGQRLISALQLNRPGADVRGMSPQLIRVVTDEAQRQVDGRDFTGLADRSRLPRAAALIAPLGVVALAVYLISPELMQALVSRQLLRDMEIPKQVTLASISPEVWPQGEQVVLRFEARGDPLFRVEAPEGEFRIRTADGLTDRFVLEMENRKAKDEAVYLARLPAMYEDFTYRAWLWDGRIRAPGRIRYVPRPVVTAHSAWVLLPDYCGKRPDGSPFERFQPKGDLVALQGSAARVTLRTQKPILRAQVEVIGKDNEPRLVDLRISGGRDGAGGTFPLKEGDTSYRLHVWDEHGFENVPAPQRGIRIVPEDPPQVTLLREEFPPSNLPPVRPVSEDFEVDGMPVPVGGRIRIAYSCSGPYGLGRAQLVYRALKKIPEGEDQQQNDATRWVSLPLVEVGATPASGPFLQRYGAFQFSSVKDQVPFHAAPSPDPLAMGRLEGGGRFDFQTKGIPDGEGGRLDLQPGDQIEFYVEVFPDKDPLSRRPTGQSAKRAKTLVTPLQFVRWTADVLQEQRRLQDLEAQQRGLVLRPAPAPQK
jgi:hypothetical protein